MRLWGLRPGAAAQDNASVDAPQTRERHIATPHEEIGRDRWGEAYGASRRRTPKNAPDANWLSSRRCGLCRNSIARAAPFAGRCASTSCSPKQGWLRGGSRSGARPVPRAKLLIPRPAAIARAGSRCGQPRSRRTRSLAPPMKCMGGDPDAVDATTGRAPAGWLGDKQSDGRRYHTLVCEDRRRGRR